MASASGMVPRMWDSSAAAASQSFIAQVCRDTRGATRLFHARLSSPHASTPPVRRHSRRDHPSSRDRCGVGATRPRTRWDADAAAARKALRSALACEIAIFTSPAAVRCAHAFGLPRTRAHVLVPGAGTLRALQRSGFAHAETPAREDSEGILALPVLQHVDGLRVGIVGAAGGRGLLDRELAARGATVVRAYVYQRLPARLD